MLMEMQNTLHALQAKVGNLEKENTTLKQSREQDAIEKETESAYKTLQEIDPNLDRKDFEKFVESTVGNMNDKAALYKLLYYARMGQNKGSIEKTAQAKMAKNIQNGKAAATETGSGIPAVTLPKNKDISGKSMDDIFEEFQKEIGTEREGGLPL
jgi:hypothetical protein